MAHGCARRKVRRQVNSFRIREVTPAARAPGRRWLASSVRDQPCPGQPGSRGGRCGSEPRHRRGI
ncbi:hypothetical protein NSU_1875 [Novosphingobium pentaromativorans US6-1]|uniref:Uncharacterized protein n=1 Tax=Novosphingobium pentaromativorans US6-1 TaxID=1088721 RepID=G6EC04_9SPHN|nr:hypothetical protein NSU_1875 [Novosphingobium pentaromativorans US6-1]